MPYIQLKISPRQRNRLIRLTISILLLVVVFTILQQQQKLGQYTISQQAREITRTLVNQAASTASQLVMEQDKTALGVMATRLSQHSAIYDAAIFDNSGNLLATNDEYKPLNERVTALISQDSEQRLDARVAAIYHEGDAIGFIQITVSYSGLIAEALLLQSLQLDRTRLAVALTLLAGLLLGHSMGSITGHRRARKEFNKES